MARTNECSHVSWAAAEVRLDTSFHTSFPFTRFVAQQLRACAEDCRVNTTPSLITAVREFMQDQNLPTPYIRAIVFQVVGMLDNLYAGIPMDTGRRNWLARFLDTLHKHLPESSLQSVSPLQLA